VFPSVNVPRALPFARLLCPFGAGRVVAGGRLNLEWLVEGAACEAKRRGRPEGRAYAFHRGYKKRLGFPEAVLEGMR